MSIHTKDLKFLLLWCTCCHLKHVLQKKTVVAFDTKSLLNNQFNTRSWHAVIGPPSSGPRGYPTPAPHPDNTCIKITDHIVIHSSFEISIPLRQNWPKHKSPPPLKVIKKMRQEYYYLKHASKPFVPTSFEISTPSIYWEKSWKKKLSLSSFVGLQCVHKRKWFS